jgi:CRISPR-associated protein Cmr4
MAIFSKEFGIIMPDQCTSILYIHALTSLHPGSGTALGVVDLPVQRERHTSWPTIPGSSLKGVLRDACRHKAGGSDEDGDLVIAFGPPTQHKDNTKHAGALSFTDARILAFPVRSLKGVFAWVTCPSVLERFERDLALAGKPPSKAPEITGNNALANKTALGAGVDGKDLVLEEFPFTITGDCGAISAQLCSAIPHDPTRERFKTHLVVISDEHFNHFVRHATEVVARIGLNYETKVVIDHALFYQEFLPAETVFYSLVISSASRNGRQKSAEDVTRYLREQLPPYLQIGGDETTGKGLCALNFVQGDRAR